jgi:hypothetical protein
MAATTKTYANFQEAYCARYRCKPDRFVTHLLVRSVPLFFRPIAAITIRANPALFAAEVDVIKNMGTSSSSREIALAVDELHGLRHVERSFWRSIGLRSDGDSLLKIWDVVKPLVAKPAQSLILDQPILASAAGSGPATPRETPAVATVRKLRQVHQEITSGKPVPEVLAAAELTEDQFLQLLAANAAGNPALGWLRDQFQRNRRVAELEAKNAELAQAVASQSIELSRLRAGSAV